MTGKGSHPRPMSVPRDEYRKRWDETFGRKHLTSDDAPEDSTEAERYMYGDRWTKQQIEEIKNQRASRTLKLLSNKSRVA